MTQWADYRGGRPSGAALKAAGFDGVIRYIGLGAAAKRITGPEYRDLAGAGVKVLLVAELDVNDAWAATDDAARGRVNALAALADARAAGIPDSVGIAAAADSHAASQRQIADAVAYATGFRDVLGLARTGFYGFNETLSAVHDAGVASWFWRCGSEPTQQEKTWVHFWQRNKAPTTRTVSGVICDINEQYREVGEVGDDMDSDDKIRLSRIYGQLMGTEDLTRGWPGYESFAVPGAYATPVDFIRALDKNVLDLSKALLAQTKLIIESVTNDVTAEGLAAALQPALAASVLPLIRDAVHEEMGVDNAAQADATATAILRKIAAKLATGADVAA